ISLRRHRIVDEPVWRARRTDHFRFLLSSLDNFELHNAGASFWQIVGGTAPLPRDAPGQWTPHCVRRSRDCLPATPWPAPPRQVGEEVSALTSQQTPPRAGPSVVRSPEADTLSVHG